MKRFLLALLGLSMSFSSVQLDHQDVKSERKAIGIEKCEYKISINQHHQ